MNNYVVIPVLALFCYIFLLLAFLASKKNTLIKSFILLLFDLLLWTLGSFCMRMNLYPSKTFWFSLSIDALFMMGYCYLNFVTEFTESNKKILRYVSLVISIIIIVINQFTGGFFISAPDEVKIAGRLQFVYTTTWTLLVPYLLYGILIFYCLFLLFRYSQTNLLSRNQILPISIGIFGVFAGNLAVSLPIFHSFPIDILCGLVNALLIFYALYQRRLFKLTLLVSRSVCYLISAIIVVILFSYLTGGYQDFIVHRFGVFGQYSILIISVSYMIVVLVFYYLIKHFVNHVFIKGELAQADKLKEFSVAISRTLHADEVLSLLIQIIQDSLHTERAFVCLRTYDGEEFHIVQSTSPLDKRSLTLAKDHPIIRCMEKSGDCILMDEFKRTPYYKAMWEHEKQQLSRLGIRLLLPLMDEDNLVGLVLLSSKERGGSYTVPDLNYLQSLAAVSSIAVCNARLYEKAYNEARTDTLTGLLNRKYFIETLEQEFNQHPGQELSLILISLDDFKLYNQLYGSKEGDTALQRVAQIIQATVGYEGYTARYEGKIFAALLPKKDMLHAKQLSEIIRKQIMEMNQNFHDFAIKNLTCSCGICAIPVGASDPTSLLNNADLALYNAKKNGKNCSRTYSQGITTKATLLPGEDVSQFKPNIYEEYAATIYALTAAIDAKDHYTFHHSQNVCYYATELARAYALDDDCIEIVKEAALLHDIGKIGIPEHILQKPGKLTDEEYEIMKSHVEQSINIIRYLPSLDYVIPAVIGHHERYDGKGYPRNLKGEEIPLLARILCIADSFDAMVSKRSYKNAYSLEYAVNEIEIGCGTQFDPELGKLFIKLIKGKQIEIHKNNTSKELEG